MKKLSIGKVSKIVNLPQSVLRYWETVFEQLNPEKSEGGTRRYTQEDVDSILEIKNLLYKKKYTIAGAISTLSKRQVNKTTTGKDTDTLIEISEELEDILAELSGSNE
ncbi:MAG: MerR family transcriptional regulator [Calditrichia bacterium]|nr:MerR family transcriptional regulator [Calditrichia bacterium]